MCVDVDVGTRYAPCLTRASPIPPFHHPTQRRRLEDQSPDAIHTKGTAATADTQPEPAIIAFHGWVLVRTPSRESSRLRCTSTVCAANTQVQETMHLCTSAPMHLCTDRCECSLLLCTSFYLGFIIRQTAHHNTEAPRCPPFVFDDIHPQQLRTYLSEGLACRKCSSNTFV